MKKFLLGYAWNNSNFWLVGAGIYIGLLFMYLSMGDWFGIIVTVIGAFSCGGSAYLTQKNTYNG